MNTPHTPRHRRVHLLALRLCWALSCGTLSFSLCAWPAAVHAASQTIGETPPPTTTTMTADCDATPASKTLQQDMVDTAERLRSMMMKGLDQSLDYDEASVEWLDGYIGRIREAFADDQGNLPVFFGAFLGEALRREHGGCWIEDEDGNLGLEIQPRFVVFPVNKASKHLANGDGDSILSFHRTVRTLLREKFSAER